LNEMNLPHPVINTLIYYTLATNKQKFVTHKLLALADLCRKFNIKNAQEAITFFKQYYSGFGARNLSNLDILTL
jgi:replication initiation and membrane attachment protein DnaB